MIFFMFCTLCRYIDAVKPGKYGVPKPFYFIFIPSYWCPRLSRRPLKVYPTYIILNTVCIFIA